MSNTVANVTTGKPKVAGGIWRAPLGSTLPTDATTALDNAFVCIGYITEDGVSLDNNIAKSVIKSWGGDIVLTNTTDSGYTFGYTCMEHLNSEVQKISYGDDNVTSTSDMTTIKATGEVGDSAAYVVERLTKDDKADRIVIPHGDITAIGSVKFADSSAITYPVTMKLIKGTMGSDSVYFKEFIEK